MTKKEKPTQKALEAAVMQKQGKGKTPSDVMGSYTGTPKDGGKPDQDADDL